MKRPKSTIPAAGLKTFLALSAVGLFCYISIAMKVGKTAEDIWKQLGLTLPEAQRNIDNSFIQGKFYYLGAKNAKNILVGDRVAVVNHIVSYAKGYVNSPEFIKAYQEYQNKRSEVIRRSLPAKPEPKTVAAIKAEELQLLERRLAEMEKNLNSENPNVKKAATAQVENIKKEIKALDDPGNPAMKRKLDLANRNFEYRNKVYNEAMQNFEAKYPSDPKPMLRQRLREILAITADVDYAAELKEGENGKKVFADPVYERKPSEWKLAFRAGKACTDAVRAAAQQWLNELDGAADTGPFHDNREPAPDVALSH